MLHGWQPCFLSGFGWTSWRWRRSSTSTRCCGEACLAPSTRRRLQRCLDDELIATDRISVLWWRYRLWVRLQESTGVNFSAGFDYMAVVSVPLQSPILWCCCLGVGKVIGPVKISLQRSLWAIKTSPQWLWKNRRIKYRWEYVCVPVSVI